jgi:hypothetical protein
MCRSAKDPSGPRRCPSHGRSKVRAAITEIAVIQDRLAGIARYLGPAEGFAHDDGSPVTWMGKADLYQVTPALNGYRQVVASTVDRVPAVKTRGTEWNIETFLFGVRDQSRVDWDELPGSAWGATAQQALHDAGYQTGDTAADG